MAQQKLYFDENCAVCSYYSGKLNKNGMLGDGTLCKLGELDPEAEEKIDFERAKNEMPLYLPEEDKTIYGIDTILHLVANKYPGLARFGRWKPNYILIRPMYKMFAFNRDVFAPNFRQTEHLMKPNHVPFYRWGFILLASLISAAITWGFASWFPNPLIIFSAIGLGWVIFFLIGALLTEKERRADVISHTSFTMLRGVIIFGIAWIGLYTSYAAFVVVPLFILLAFLDMNIQMSKRMRLLRLRGLYFVWLASLLITSIGTLYFFI